MFSLNPNFYYLSIGLQALCVFHCIKKGNQNKWIWIIVFLPVVGCIAYFFTEIVTGRDLQRVQSDIGEAINPSASIKKLERNLRFADTFANKVALADAYLAAGFTDKAIGLYESSKVGVFEENEHIMLQLIHAYYIKERYQDLALLVRKIYKLPQFSRSRAHLLYAKALEKLDRIAEAEKEFKLLQGKFCQFEARYEYGRFLIRQNRSEEGYAVFSEIVNEKAHLSARERRYYQVWFAKAKDELKKTQAVS